MGQLTATGFVVSDSGARVGEKAPAYSLPCTRESEGAAQTIALTDYRGKWLIMLFYPLSFSPVSHSELTAFDGCIEVLSKRNTELLAISTDSVYVHRTWLGLARGQGGLHGLRFPLASDVTHAVASAYGVLIEDQGHAQRATFIVDPRGIIRYAVTHDPCVGRSVAETLRVLAALGTGENCLVDWELPPT